MSILYIKRFSGLRSISKQLSTVIRRTSRRPSLTLTALPLEILELILTHLEDKELPPLRLLSRDLNRKLTHVFGKRCLRVIHTSLFWPELQRLQAISEHVELRDYVRVLKIADDVKQSFWQNPRLSTHANNQDAYPGIETFKRILSAGLKNCRSFYVCSVAEDWDFHNGWLRPSPSKASDVVAILLSVISDLKLEVEEFRIRVTDTDRRVSFRREGDQHTLLLSQFPKPGFKKAWEGLQRLEVAHKGSPYNLDWVIPLVTSARGLRELKICLGYGDSETILFQLSEAEYLPPLEKLTIGTHRSTQSILNKLLLRCGQNLRYLSIWHVRLVSGTWKSVFKEIKNGFPALEEVSVAHVRELDGLSRWQRVVFPGLLDDPKGGRVGARRMNVFVGVEGVERHRVLGATYVGPKAGEFLGLLEVCAVLLV